MNRVLIVTCDLGDPQRNYEELLRVIKSYPGWARLGNSSYLISTTDTPAIVRDNLVSVLNGKDQVFVGWAPAPSAWRGLPHQVGDWIRENQS
jgi:hypothetical protein